MRKKQTTRFFKNHSTVEAPAFDVLFLFILFFPRNRIYIDRNKMATLGGKVCVEKKAANLETSAITRESQTRHQWQ
jgi:hypothetical protein